MRLLASLCHPDQQLRPARALPAPVSALGLAQQVALLPYHDHGYHQHLPWPRPHQHLQPRSYHCLCQLTLLQPAYLSAGLHSRCSNWWLELYLYTQGGHYCCPGQEANSRCPPASDVRLALRWWRHQAVSPVSLAAAVARTLAGTQARLRCALRMRLRAVQPAWRLGGTKR